MKVSDAIAQLQAMPAGADLEIEIGEEFHDFTIKWRTKGENYPNGAHLVVIVPPEMSAAEKTADELLAALQSLLPRFERCARTAGNNEETIGIAVAPYLVVIAKATGAAP